MPVTIRAISEFIVECRGMSTEDAPAAFWFDAVGRVGDALQEKIGESFSRERVAGTSALVRNSPDWNQYKAANGLDPRRGHASNNLQRNLDGPKRLFQVRKVSARKGTVAYRIHFLEAWLHSRVPYSVYYEERKVRRKGILSLARSWITEVLPILRGAEADAALRRRRATNRQVPIRPTLGLDRAFIRRIIG